MAQSDMRAHIADRLDRLEATHDITVLYACESGSRAWGFASADSDYDVRAVYVHPRNWYLSIDLDRRDDTIDPSVDGELDLHAWDLRKALSLFHRANPTLLDWLQSPIVYRADEAVMARWRDRIPDYYTPRAQGHAYRGLARSVADESLAAEPIAHKAYLYVLRALMAVRWVEQGRGPVPVAFDRLLEGTVEDPDLRDAMEALLAEKRAGTEATAGPRRPVLHDWIDAELDRQAELSFPDADRPGIAPLNALFRAVLR
jgi:predicted nucleotidyltransferase